MCACREQTAPLKLCSRRTPLMVILRRATLEDASLLFEWRNDPLTRENSHNQAPVPWEVHCQWLSSSLKNPSRTLFIGTEGRPVGTSRLDRNPTYVELSYTVAPKVRGKGYGQALVRETLLHCEGPVRARAKTQNRPSRKILQKAGFKLESEKDGVLTYLLKQFHPE